MVVPWLRRENSFRKRQSTVERSGMLQVIWKQDPEVSGIQKLGRSRLMVACVGGLSWSS